MGDIPVRQKQPTEARTLGFDFTEKLGAGDSLSGSPTITVTPAGLTAASSSVVGRVVYVRLQGGTAGSDYRVEVKMSTANGDTLELDASIEVRENAN